MSQQNRIGAHCTTVRTKDGITIVTYHNTEVIRFNDYSIVLNSGGWQTATTKVRMNQASNQCELGFNVFQKDYQWFVTTRAGTFTFRDHMSIDRETMDLS